MEKSCEATFTSSFFGAVSDLRGRSSFSVHLKQYTVQMMSADGRQDGNKQATPDFEMAFLNFLVGNDLSRNRNSFSWLYNLILTWKCLHLCRVKHKVNDFPEYIVQDVQA